MGLNILKTWLDLILAWQNILGLMWAKYFSKHYSFVIMYARTGMRFQLAQWTSKSFTMLLCSLMVHDYYHDYYPLEVNLIILVSDWLVMKPSICPCAMCMQPDLCNKAKICQTRFLPRSYHSYFKAQIFFIHVCRLYCDATNILPISKQCIPFTCEQLMSWIVMKTLSVKISCCIWFTPSWDCK